MTHDDDSWLDAFRPEDLKDPVLAEVDAAVTRTAGPTARRRRVGVWILGVIATAAVAAWFLRPVQPAGVVTPAAPVLATVGAGPVETVARRSEDLRQDRPVGASPVASEPAGPATPARHLPAVAPAEPPEAQPPKRPGLHARSGTRATIDGDTVDLEVGVLTYRHDATHEPGVRIVRLADPPIQAVPVGTAFVVGNQDGLGVVRVTEGTVWLQHHDGRPITRLMPGDEALVFGSTSVGWVTTTDIALDSLERLLPRDRRKASVQAVSLVASTRLAAREAIAGVMLPFTLPAED